MSIEILVNIAPREMRAAVVENGALQDVFIERPSRKGLVSNLYKGRVSRVLPGMQAAFLDIGVNGDHDLGHPVDPLVGNDQRVRAERGEHLVEMVALVQHRQTQTIGGSGHQKHPERCHDDPHQKRLGEAVRGCCEIGAQHVQHAVRQVDEAHDAEHQRESGCQQKEQDAELKSVQELRNEQAHRRECWRRAAG